MRSFQLREIGRFVDASIQRKQRMRLYVVYLLPTAAAWLLSGCTLLPMKDLQPVIAPPTPDGGVTCIDSKTQLRGEVITPHMVQYLLPRDAPDRMHRPMIGTVTDFEQYRSLLIKRVSDKLPGELPRDPVMTALLDFLISASGEAQLDDQIAAHLLDPTIPSDQATIARQRGLILKYASAPKLKHKELRNFLNRLFDLQLKRGPADFLGASTNPEILSLKGQALSSRPSFDAGLAAYFKAYYDDKFYNRMGGQIAKPQMPTLP